MDGLTAPVLRIARAQLACNIRAVQQRIAPSDLMLVLKDDAYGHGLEHVVDVARSAEVPVSRFGGYDVHTSLRVRERAGDMVRVFAWATSSGAEVRAAIHAGIELGVGTAPYLRRVISVAEECGTPARVHLKVDTGLHRNGFRAEEWPDTVAEAARAHRSGTIVLVGVWSHLAEASDEEDDESARRFASAVQVVRDAGILAETHLTASAASWWRPELRGTVSRVGAFCYGIRSAGGPAVPGVLPVASLEARVLAIQDGELVIGVGRLHGIPSTLAGMTIGTDHGAQRTLRIDETTTVARTWPGARIGDVVRLFGPGGQGEDDATTLGERIGTVGEEILTRISPLVRREYT